MNDYVINAALARINTGAVTSIISGFANGSDGRLLTLMNASAATATIKNQSSLSATANRIITGQNADLQVGPNQSVLLVYDSGSNRWRIVGGSGGSGNTIIQTLATSSASVLPVLQNDDTQVEQGHIFIYRNQIYAMGNNNNTNSAGSPNIAGSPLVVPVASPAPSGWSSVVAAYDSMCAISNVGDVWCMGSGSTGQTGQGIRIARGRLSGH